MGNIMSRVLKTTHFKTAYNKPPWRQCPKWEYRPGHQPHPWYITGIFRPGSVISRMRVRLHLGTSPANIVPTRDYHIFLRGCPDGPRGGPRGGPGWIWYRDKLNATLYTEDLKLEKYANKKYLVWNIRWISCLHCWILQGWFIHICIFLKERITIVNIETYHLAYLTVVSLQSNLQNCW